jgi:hypothetical protein
MFCIDLHILFLETNAILDDIHTGLLSFGKNKGTHFHRQVRLYILKYFEANTLPSSKIYYFSCRCRYMTKSILLVIWKLMGYASFHEYISQD